MELPAEIGQFGFIYSEGVLHHTDSTEGAIRALAKRLAPGGHFMFYVYNKKGPVREFADDHVRREIAGLTDAEAWHALEPLTKLGIALGELGVEVDVKEPVDVLGIPAGKIDVQRLFYWYVAKAFYRPEFSFGEMNHINFDWYRPANCHRQTPEQVRSWIGAAGLEVVSLNTALEGISVIARRPS